MPAHPCHHPTCTRYLAPGASCPDHPRARQASRARRDAFYDQHRRDPEARRFYNSAEWLRARAAALAARPVCQRCLAKFAEHVHHIVPLNECTPAQRVDPDNLLPVCAGCHNAIETEVRAAR